MQNCALCNPPVRQYRRGLRTIDALAGYFVEVKGGKGVYHHLDCYNVTGDWDGADLATLGELVLHSESDLRTLDLRPARCCQPPRLTRP
jgi:hypothetical protein